jgi:hypothetical protein
MTGASNKCRLIDFSAIEDAVSFYYRTARNGAVGYHGVITGDATENIRAFE